MFSKLITYRYSQINPKLSNEDVKGHTPLKYRNNLIDIFKKKLHLIFKIPYGIFFPDVKNNLELYQYSVIFVMISSTRLIKINVRLQPGKTYILKLFYHQKTHLEYLYLFKRIWWMIRKNIISRDFSNTIMHHKKNNYLQWRQWRRSKFSSKLW